MSSAFDGLTDDQLVARVEALPFEQLREFAPEIERENARRGYPLIEHDDIYAEFKDALEQKRLDDARARGIPVVNAPADRCVFSGERLPFERVRPQLPRPRLRASRVRHRAPRRNRATCSRTRGSRRTTTRGAPSDDPGEPEPGPGLEAGAA